MASKQALKTYIRLPLSVIESCEDFSRLQRAREDCNGAQPSVLQAYRAWSWCSHPVCMDVSCWWNDKKNYTSFSFQSCFMFQVPWIFREVLGVQHWGWGWVHYNFFQWNQNWIHSIALRFSVLILIHALPKSSIFKLKMLVNISPSCFPAIFQALVLCMNLACSTPLNFWVLLNGQIELSMIVSSLFIFFGLMHWGTTPLPSTSWLVRHLVDFNPHSWLLVNIWWTSLVFIPLDGKYGLRFLKLTGYIRNQKLETPSSFPTSPMATSILCGIFQAGGPLSQGMLSYPNLLSHVNFSQPLHFQPLP